LKVYWNYRSSEVTDSHTHISVGDDSAVEFIAGRDFFGVHPWRFSEFSADALMRSLVEHPKAGVGEIGLDRLKSKEIPSQARDVFAEQLKIAYEYERPVTLHGAKCWGQIVAQIRQVEKDFHFRPTFLFHGFSRSDGLVPEIMSLRGFISIGPQILNLHAVNYRKMAKSIPLNMLLVETDRTEENLPICPRIEQVLLELAKVRGISPQELEKATDLNARRFILGEYEQ
jgi:TatD DNase family protein